MTDPYEPPADRGQRMIGVTALGFAVALLVLLGVGCYGALWTFHAIMDLFASVVGD